MIFLNAVLTIRCLGSGFGQLGSVFENCLPVEIPKRLRNSGSKHVPFTCVPAKLTLWNRGLTALKACDLNVFVKYPFRAGDARAQRASNPAHSVRSRKYVVKKKMPVGAAGMQKCCWIQSPTDPHRSELLLNGAFGPWKVLDPRKPPWKGQTVVNSRP
jgi:hypothetical protein